MGSRYGGIKQIAPVGRFGETILEYSLYDALEAGFDRIVFLLRRDIEGDFRDAILSRLPVRLRSCLAFQEIDSLLGSRDAAKARASGRSKPWGTGHALLCAACELDSPFAVVNADDFYGRQSFRLVHAFLAEAGRGTSHWCMAGYALRNTTSPKGYVSRGLCELDAFGHLVSVTEHTRLFEEGGGFVSVLEDGSRLVHSGDEVVSMNLWGFDPSIFSLAMPLFDSFIESRAADPKAEFYLPGMISDLMTGGQAKVSVLRTTDTWFGLTWREDAQAARTHIARLVESGSYPEPLWSRT